MRTLLVALIAVTLAGGITGGVRAGGSGPQQLPPLNVGPSDIIYDYDDPLKGLSEIDIVVERLESDAEECGIREEALRLAAARPLLDGGIRVVDKIQSAHIYVIVSVLTTSSGCVASVFVLLQDYVNAPLRNKNEVGRDNTLVLTQTEVVYERTGSLLTGPKLNFGDRVMAAVRDQVDSIVTKIKLANQE